MSVFVIQAFVKMRETVSHVMFVIRCRTRRSSDETTKGVDCVLRAWIVITCRRM